MANRFTDPRPQFASGTLTPYAGGALFFYLTTTTTKTNTYSDANLTTPNTNPVVLDADGRIPNDIFLDPNVTYKVVLAAAGYSDPPTSDVWTADPVDDPAANVTAAVQVIAGNPNGTLAGSAGTPGGSGASVAWDIINNLLYVCTTSGSATTAAWTQVASEFAGAFSLTSTISPTSISGAQADYAPTGFADCSIVRQDSSANVVYSGWAGGSNGRRFTYHNVSSYIHYFYSESSLSTAANRFLLTEQLTVYPNQSVTFSYDASSSRWRQEGAYYNPPAIVPGGRLTLTSGTPVLTSDVTGATTIYYTPYIHGFIDLLNANGTWYTIDFSELSQTLADTTKSPAATLADSSYDMFVWRDDNVTRLSRGPAWSTATARGTGAGTTELELYQGRWVNKNAISNGPVARMGRYVGTIMTNASNAVPMVWKPAAASGGAACYLYIWNAYNRVRFGAVSRDNKDTWNYGTGSFRSTDNSTNNRVHIVRGLQVDDAEVMAVGSAGNDLNIRLMVGLGLDSASHHSDAVVGCGCPVDVNEPVSMIAHYRGDPGLGYHYFQALEWGGGSGTTTWRGDNGLEQMQGLFVSVWA